MLPVTEKSKLRLILASASPRRSALLSQTGIHFETFPVTICESIFPGENPKEAVKRLAVEKIIFSQKILKISWDAIIAADTIVWIEGSILGKPENSKEAVKMLKLLSGKTHKVFTGVALLKNGWKKPIVTVEKTQVTFCKLSRDDITNYIATDEPLGKAGAYAIQGKGAFFVRKINGCYYNVVGLPLYRLKLLLTKASLSSCYL